MHTALLLEMAAGAAPDRPALGRISDGMTFADMHARAHRAAMRLAAFAGDKVVFIGLNGPAFPIALFASGMIGRAFVPLNYRLPDTDLTKLLARTTQAVAIVDDEMLHRLPPVPGVAVLALSAFEDACGDSAFDRDALPDIEPDVAVLLFTSGTTGEPKAALLRHRNLTAYVTTSVEFFDTDENEASLVSVPPYHIAGIAAILTSVYSGRRLVYLPSFTPESWVEVAIVERVTHAMVVPTMLGRILDVLETTGQRLPDMRAISYGGGRMPQPVIARALKMMPQVDFANGYGLTETSSTIAVLGPQDHRDALASPDEHIRRRIASVGRPLPSIEVEIRGLRGESLSPGQTGEIYVRGEQVSGEYTHKKAIRDDGWFATNDGGWMDEHGYLYIEGRLDDVIVRGGENISPGEIEDVLREHPGVGDVAVLGIPDDEWGECVAAAVVTRNGQPGADELSAWVRSRLRSTKTPEIWEFRDALPYNDTGKLLRRQLKSEMAAKRSAVV